MSRKPDILSLDEFDIKPNAIKTPQNGVNLSPRRYDYKYLVDNDNQISPPPLPFSKNHNEQSHNDCQIGIIGNYKNERDCIVDHQNDHMIHQQSQIPNRLTKINRQIFKTQPIIAKPPINPRRKINNVSTNKTESIKDFNVHIENVRNDELDDSPDIHSNMLPKIDSVLRNKQENKLNSTFIFLSRNKVFQN